MDRRTFIKNAAMAAASTTVAAPVAAMVANESRTQIMEEHPLAAQEKKEERKLKVLMVNGSPRPDGNTFCALKEMEGQLVHLGLDVEIIQIGRKPVRMCINCGGCHRNGSEGCVFDDDLCNTISEKMSQADALVVGSPVYYGQPNGGVLALMQRVFFSAGKNVQNKPAAAVAVCRRGGATAALQTMNMMFEMMNMPVVTSQYWNIVYGMDKGEAKLDTGGMQTMRARATNMAWLLEKMHAGEATAPEYEKDKKFMNFIR